MVIVKSPLTSLHYAGSNIKWRKGRRMNKKGQIRPGIILNLLFFLMALGVLVVFISPINELLDIAQQSDNLNCKGYIYEGDPNHQLSFNETLDGGQSGSPLACLAIKLYLPYIFLVFLVAGIGKVLYEKVTVGGEETGFE